MFSKIHVSTLLGVAAAFGFASQAQALTIADPGALNASAYVAHNNDLGLAGGTNQSVLVGYSLHAPGPGSLTYTYVGKEAGYTNRVTFSPDAGGCGFNTSTAIIGQSCTDSTDGGLLSFNFTSNGTSSTVGNGQNFSIGGLMVFGLIQLTENSWYILLDDSGGNPNDKDFDDLGLLLTFRPTSVPEPGTFVLLGLGLLGMLPALRRRPAIRSVR